PLKFSQLGAADTAEIREDSRSLLGIYPEDHRFAVLLHPEWLPLIAGLKLGVQTRAADGDYQEIFMELSGLFVTAVRSHFEAHGSPVDCAPLQIKGPGEDLDESVVESITYKLPFFMEWEGSLLHGFVLVSKADAQDSEIQVETDSEQSTPPQTDTMEDNPDPADQARAADPVQATGPAGTPHDAKSYGSKDASPLAPSEPRIQVQAAAFPELGAESSATSGAANLGLLAGVELEVTVELGRRRMALSDILRLTNGSVLELEKLVGEPLQVFANNRLIAEGEAVVIDEQFGVRITALAARGAAKLVR
ncbi:MAG: flagellar motor switch protein FliN/FliY, partial [Rhodothermales bacterium]